MVYESFCAKTDDDGMVWGGAAVGGGLEGTVARAAAERWQLPGLKYSPKTAPPLPPRAPKAQS